jgi:RNA polymerase sigma-70 factor (ECF subfamily)
VAPVSRIDRLERSCIVNALDATDLPELPETGVAAGDRLDALFRSHYGRLARVVGRIVHDQAQAEEIAVDVFLRWRRHPAAHGEGAEGWLYRTAVRSALDAWRRRQRWSRLERVLVHLRLAPPTPGELHDSDAARQQVRAALAALRPRDATLLLLWAEDVGYVAIAGAVGVQPSSVGSLLRRAQDAFRKEYEARYGQPF